MYLLGLIASAVLPVWIFATYLLVSFAFSKQQDFRDSAVQFARHAATVVDSSLTEGLARLDGLARSAEMADGKLPELHGAARRLVAGTGQEVMLVDSEGRLLFSTAVDFGKASQPLPGFPVPDPAKVFRDREQVSDVLAGTGGADAKVAVLRAVSVRGADAAILVLTIPARTLHDVLVPAVPDGWVIGVADRNGVYVTRSQRHEEVAGTPGLPAYLEQARGTSGSFESTNRFGDTLLAGYVRSNVSGWLYAANIPTSVVEAPLWRSIGGAAGIGLCALLVSLLLASAVGRYLTREARDLASRAMSLARGEQVAPLATHLKEFAVVGEAFGAASKVMAERTKELEAVLETVPAAVWFTYDPAGRLVVRNRFAAELMGLPPDDPGRFNIPDQVIDTVAMKDGKVVSREDRPLTRAMRGEHTDHEEFAYLLPSGGERFLLSSARPITDEDGSVLGAVQVSLDITDRKRGEEQRRLLSKELNHRVKNNLAIVQALSQQTIRNAGSLAEAGKALSARLAALGAAHNPRHARIDDKCAQIRCAFNPDWKRRHYLDRSCGFRPTGRRDRMARDRRARRRQAGRERLWFAADQAHHRRRGRLLENGIREGWACVHDPPATGQKCIAAGRSEPEFLKAKA